MYFLCDQMEKRWSGEHNGWHFLDDITKCILIKQISCTLIQISLNSVAEDSIDNMPISVEVMASCWIDDKPLLMMT